MQFHVRLRLYTLVVRGLELLLAETELDRPRFELCRRLRPIPRGCRGMVRLRRVAVVRLVLGRILGRWMANRSLRSSQLLLPYRYSFPGGEVEKGKVSG